VGIYNSALEIKRRISQARRPKSRQSERELSMIEQEQASEVSIVGLCKHRAQAGPGASLGHTRLVPSGDQYCCKSLSRTGLAWRSAQGLERDIERLWGTMGPRLTL
jgi:hypothetical protein